MKNTLVIYRLSDNRVIHVADQSYGMPVIGDYDSTALWDSSSMDYQVGVEVYAEGDFDPETDLLTDDACATYGIDTGEKAKYIKDLAITIPEMDETAQFVDDLMVTLDGGQITEVDKLTPLASTERQTFLKLSVATGFGVEVTGTDPYNGLSLVSQPDSPGSSYLAVHVQKYDIDGNALTGASDDDGVVFRMSSGMVNGDYIKNLVNGAAYFHWLPTSESIKVRFEMFPTEIYAPGKELIPGALEIQMDSN